MKKVVISGVNLIEGGPLKVLQDAIVAFHSACDVELICLVHDASLFKSCGVSADKYMSFPDVKSNWIRRLYFEYFQCWKLAKKLEPEIWLSMHDMSTRLDKTQKIKQFVYCHNPSPFYHATIRDFIFEPKFFLFSKLYKYLYKINIKSNWAVICQQSWVKEFFENEIKASNVIVAKPNSPIGKNIVPESTYADKNPQVITIFYPALPRVFKNFELILNAMQYLNTKNITDKEIQLVLTFDGSESKYAKWIHKKYSHLKNVKFVGRLERNDVSYYYELSDLVIFPSKLETWGLPIVEAKEFNKPIFLADLPYAHETLGVYDKAKFINTQDYVLLANNIKDFITGKIKYDPTKSDKDIGSLNNWAELVDLILSY